MDSTLSSRVPLVATFPTFTYVEDVATFGVNITKECSNFSTTSSIMTFSVLFGASVVMN